MPTPKLQGLAEAMAKLEHSLESEAGKLHAEIASVGDRGLAAIGKGRDKVAGIKSRIGEIETFVSALEGSNGGDPLEGSSDSSAPASESSNPANADINNAVAHYHDKT